MSAAGAVLALVLATGPLAAEQPGGMSGRDMGDMGNMGGHATSGKASKPKPSVRTTMEALHRHGGVPPGWRFSVPAGDAKAGREAFAKFECYRCHAVTGESFPAPSGKGPELTGMGSHHPAAYFAESVMNPNAVIIIGPGYTGPDGRSIMPDYVDTMSVKELIDLVAYLRSLTVMAPGAGPHHGMPMTR